MNRGVCRDVTNESMMTHNNLLQNTVDLSEEVRDWLEMHESVYMSEALWNAIEGTQYEDQVRLTASLGFVAWTESNYPRNCQFVGYTPDRTPLNLTWEVIATDEILLRIA